MSNFSEWPVAKLCEIAQIYSGGTPSRADPSMWNGDVPWLTPGELTKKTRRTVLSTAESITKGAIRSSGAVLLPVSTLMVTTRATLGSCALAGLPMATNQGFKNLAFNKEIADPEFYYFVLREMSSEMKRRASGTTFLEIPVGEFGNLSVPVPPLHEQRRIVEILDEADNVRRAHQRTLEKISLVRKGIIAQAMSLERGDFCSKLGDLASLIVDGVHHTPTYRETGVPFITVENLTRGPGISLDPVRRVSKGDHASYARRADPAPGDILVSKDGTLGVARVIPEGLPEFSIFVSVALIKPKRSLLNPVYGCAFFESPEFFRQLRRISSGTGLNHIHLKDFKAFEINAPALNLQESWVIRLGELDDAMRKEREAMLKMERVSQGLVTDLIAGRVRVPVTSAV
ncbi:restriction endonuclease subunit S [Streptomyces sp. NPDC056930]|uniref:restriction endonuclease subunit S n=1 Tax=Streptomyces sp. NPDC056930 TaxID=3345967 RepID=UPI00362F43FC